MTTEIKKELVLRIKQKIGDVEVEIEAIKGKKQIELAFTEDGVYIGSMNFEPYELARLARFFETANAEVEKLNS